MMKRVLACVLAAVCLLACFALAEENLGNMKVIKVNEAVNMRKGPSTDTDKVGQVPLGAIVNDCHTVDGSDWIAVNYQGVAGYIRGDFLEAVPGEAPAPVEASAPVEAPAQAEQPVAAEETLVESQPLVETGAEEKYDGPVVTGDEYIENAPITDINQPTLENYDDAKLWETTLNGMRIVARQIFMDANEYLMVAALDENGNTLWKRETMTEDVSEMTQTDAFVAGTIDMPLVMIYNDWYGLTALDPATGAIRWTVLKDDVFLGGSISRAVGGNGVIYVGGYYGPDPVAIDAGGNVLWQASSGDLKATWMYAIELQSDGILCRYSNMGNDNTGAVVYDFNGAVKDVIYD